ncbi:hypothetical protein [Rubrivivax gelatinosus]|uniref:hypothetical protein n=1 Tax=Rubrivivax gelatinosus TaxID=28068 RepID=UPI0005C166BB|nr:hypothetical protein [Rubrivivax gelatinosus]
MRLIVTPVPVLDSIARLAGRAVAKLVPSVAGAGAFWVAGGPSFVDAWKEDDAFNLRLGRLELILDRRR